MIIKNVKIYTKDMVFQDGDICMQNGVFATGSSDGVIINGEGCYAIPGLIDLHFHGCGGYDICDGTLEAVTKIAESEAAFGVTAIAPATMTLPAAKLEQILHTAAVYHKSRLVPQEHPAKTGKKAADLIGINMEGPFISEAKKGAQDPQHILSCNVQTAQNFLKVSEGLVKFIGIAPEKNPGFAEFISELKDAVHISLAHTNADYETAMEAFRAGADHAVHLYNAMPPFTHREPGVVGAVADSPHVFAELICDGIHIHPCTVRATFRMLGWNRIVFISDSMRAAGMPDGHYTLGGLNVNKQGRRVTLASNGSLAGSASNLMECLRTAVTQMGIPLETAVACCSVNPAKCLGVYGERGSVEIGKKADLVLLNKALAVQMVIKDGAVL